MCSSALVCWITVVLSCTCLRLCVGGRVRMASFQLTANGQEWRLVQMAHHYGNPLQKHPSYSHRRGKRQRERDRQTGEDGKERPGDKQSEALSHREGWWEGGKKRRIWKRRDWHMKHWWLHERNSWQHKSCSVSTTARPRATNNQHAASQQQQQQLKVPHRTIKSQYSFPCRFQASAAVSRNLSIQQLWYVSETQKPIKVSNPSGSLMQGWVTQQEPG